MPSRILVLLIEDNGLVRDGLAALLDAQPDFQVVAVAEEADAGAKLARGLQPHVVLVGGGMGNQVSHHLVSMVLAASPQSRVIVMDLPPSQQDAAAAFVRAGACAFIVKDATLTDVVWTIRSVAAGAGIVRRADFDRRRGLDGFQQIGHATDAEPTTI